MAVGAGVSVVLTWLDPALRLCVFLFPITPPIDTCLRICANHTQAKQPPILNYAVLTPGRGRPMSAILAAGLTGSVSTCLAR